MFDSVAFIMTETANSYEQIMSIPFAVMLATVKHIRIKYLMQNEDWCKAYQQYLKKEA